MKYLAPGIERLLCAYIIKNNSQMTVAPNIDDIKNNNGLIVSLLNRHYHINFYNCFLILYHKMKYLPLNTFI